VLLTPTVVSILAAALAAAVLDAEVGAIGGFLSLFITAAAVAGVAEAGKEAGCFLAEVDDGGITAVAVATEVLLLATVLSSFLVGAA
jgi:hypothetical protein